MEKKFVVYNGVQVIEGWPDKIEESQSLRFYKIGERDVPRVKYGDEKDDWGANQRPCHDCAVIKGQYHVFNMCDVERCPICDGQAIGCDCDYEGDDDDEDSV